MERREGGRGREGGGRERDIKHLLPPNATCPHCAKDHTVRPQHPRLTLLQRMRHWIIVLETTQSYNYPLMTSIAVRPLNDGSSIGDKVPSL